MEETKKKIEKQRRIMDLIEEEMNVIKPRKGEKEKTISKIKKLDLSQVMSEDAKQVDKMNSYTEAKFGDQFGDNAEKFDRKNLFNNKCQ